MPTFRVETRAWLEENCPPAMRTFMPENEQVAGGKRAQYVRPEQKQWLDRMAEKGWTAPTWPRKYGGGGLSGDEALILEEEMQDLGCRAPFLGQPPREACDRFAHCRVFGSIFTQRRCH